MSNVIDFKNVAVRRGGHEILHVSWQVHDGERWVVLGPNGAGKTTLVQLAAARMFPTSGVAKVLEERLGSTDVSELRPRIGLASSALSGLIPSDEKVRDVVMTGAYAVTGRWREVYDEVDAARANELLHDFGISALAGRAYGTLSSGEQKRTVIARALMPDPELLLLDEPSAGLDLATREKLLITLGALAKNPNAPVTVLVTHDVESIPAEFTHLLLLRGGKVVAAGPIGATLTSANLSSTFGMPITVNSAGGRYYARATDRHIE